MLPIFDLLRPRKDRALPYAAAMARHGSAGIHAAWVFPSAHRPRERRVDLAAIVEIKSAIDYESNIANRKETAVTGSRVLDYILMTEMK